MSYINPEDIGFRDSAALDAFQRLRVSMANTMADAQQEYGLDTRTTWDAVANGTPSFANSNGYASDGLGNSVGPRNVNTGYTPVTVSGTNGHYSVLQMGQFARYIPGKSHNIVITGIFASGANATARFVLRTGTSGSASDAEFVNQADWSEDTFGAGAKNPSGLTIDFTKVQILVIDAQMLYAGRVRVGFDIGGRIWWAHYFNIANDQILPTMQTFCLPPRMEIRNTGVAQSKARVGYFEKLNGVFLETERAVAGGTVEFLCCSVQSEGGEEARGVPRSASNGTTSIPVTTRRPILSIRPRATYNGRVNRAHIEAIEFIVRAASVDVHAEVVIGGTLTGAGWLPVGRVVAAGSFVVGQMYVITTLGTTDFTLIGASANTLGLEFRATGVGAGTGTATVLSSVAEYDTSATAITGGVVVKQLPVAAGSTPSRGDATGGDADIRNPLVLRQIDDILILQTPITIVCTSFGAAADASGTFNWHEQVI